MLLYLDAVQKAPLNHRGHFYLANEWLKRGQYDLAELEVDRALQLAEFPDYYQTKALIHYFREDYAKGLVSVEKALHLWLKPSYYVTRSHIYLKMGKIDSAVADCLRALVMDPRMTRAYVALGRLYDEKGEFKQAEETYRKAILLDPDFQTAFLDLAALYGKQGFREKGIEILKEFLKRHPASEKAKQALQSYSQA